MVTAVRTIEADATTTGSPAAVWALSADATACARWGPSSEVEVEGGGHQGAGAIRVLVKAPARLGKRITDCARLAKAASG